MSTRDSTDELPVADTGAFRAFYGEEPSPDEPRGLLYRLFVGWWRDRG
jgi:hypothetical protein